VTALTRLRASLSPKRERAGQSFALPHSRLPESLRRFLDGTSHRVSGERDSALVSTG
jgi:hypothetical protein